MTTYVISVRSRDNDTKNQNSKGKHNNDTKDRMTTLKGKEVLKTRVKGDVGNCIIRNKFLVTDY